MTELTRTPSVYTIPAHCPFAETLARGIIGKSGGDPYILSRYLILLPTRRACRTLRDAFLKITAGKPLLLPRLHPIGDIDEDELFLSMDGADELDLPPAISAIERQILLARLIGSMGAYSKGPEQNMLLAKALGHFMDQVYTEDLDLKDLPELVDDAALAEHWQITVQFLEILSRAWPDILAEKGVIDAADRRNRLIKALCRHWQSKPPETPVIAAGSTGSIPATAELLKVTAHLPQGRVVLPGADPHLDDQSWNMIDSTHPQATIKKLLSKLECERQDIKIWPGGEAKTNSIREKLISEVMRPADSAEKWADISFTQKEIAALKEDLETHVCLYTCGTPQDEAELIAVMLREILEDPEKTAALVTGDRTLARRVAATCGRWGIQIDDSGGQSLAQSRAGSFLNLCVQACLSKISPVPFLSLMKHTLMKGSESFRRQVREIELIALRGPKPAPGFEGIRQNLLKQKTDYPDLISFLDQLENIMSPFIQMMQEGYHEFEDQLKTHIQMAESLSCPDFLWRGEDGEKAAELISRLMETASSMPRLKGEDYSAIINQFLESENVRPAYGTHPRLIILGRLESRLVQADRVIMGGMNEGSWPPDPGNDPWMSRPMREKFGLPSPEQMIGLSAHDFTQCLSVPEVCMTRAKRVDGVPTVPSRWIQRLQTVMKAMDIEEGMLTNGPHPIYKQRLDLNENHIAISRPEPRPPVTVRPEELSVTRIETWLRDPYSIYARYILNLKKLEPLEKQPDAADRGTLLHNILEKFCTAYPETLPEDAKGRFVTIGLETLEENVHDAEAWHFWQSRLINIADWFIDQERHWRARTRLLGQEINGKIKLVADDGSEFTLTAIADRIDSIHTGGTAIIDYKSGGQYNESGILSGKFPQLPLEALIQQQGGFGSIPAKDVQILAYWKLTGGSKAGEIITLKQPEKISESVRMAHDGLKTLITRFYEEAAPYYSIPDLDNAPRYNDYEHLARVKEWAALGETEDTA